MWAWVVGVGGRGPGGSGLGWDPLLGRRARQITSKSKRLDQTGCPGGLLQKRRGPAAAPRFRQFELPVPSAAAASGQAGLHRHRLGPPPCRDRERHQKYSSTMIPCSRRPGSLCTTHLAPLPSPTRLRIHIVTHVQSTKYILHMERLRWIWQPCGRQPGSCGTAEECTPGPTLGPGRVALGSRIPSLLHASFNDFNSNPSSKLCRDAPTAVLTTLLRTKALPTAANTHRPAIITACWS
jgi:hypothetical protein